MSRVLSGGRILRPGADVPVTQLNEAHCRSRAGMAGKAGSYRYRQPVHAWFGARSCARSRAQDGRHTSAPC